MEEKKTVKGLLVTAKIIRVISIPPVMVSALIVLLSTLRSDIFTKGLQITLAFLFLAVFPVLAYPFCYFLPKLRKKGRETQRKIAFIFTGIGYTAGWVWAMFRIPPFIRSLSIPLTFSVSSSGNRKSLSYQSQRPCLQLCRPDRNLLPLFRYHCYRHRDRFLYPDLLGIYHYETTYHNTVSLRNRYLLCRNCRLLSLLSSRFLRSLCKKYICLSHYLVPSGLCHKSVC